METDRLISMYHGGSMADLERAAGNYVKQFPEQSFGWKVLGVSLQKQGRYSDAIPAYRKAVALASGDPELHNNLGVALKEVALFTEAESSIRTALTINPSYAMAYNNLGNILRAQGKLDASLDCYRKALEIHPGFALAYNNIGNGYKESGLYEKALEAYLSALEIDAEQKEALHNTGLLLMDLGRLKEALWYFRRLHELDAKSIDTINLLGTILQELGMVAEAEQLYRQALDEGPEHSAAWINLGNVLLEQGKISEMKQAYGQALTQENAQVAAMMHLAMATLPVVVSTVEESQDAISGFAMALDNLIAFAEPCNWDRLGRSICVRAPFHLSYRPGNHRTLLSRYGDVAAKARKVWARHHVESTEFLRPEVREDRVKLGIVCGHVRKHSVWFVMLKGLLTHLDRSRFEVTLYYTGTIHDEETDFARLQVDRFEQGPKDWLKLLQKDTPDILLYPELAMDLVSMELALLRLAPLQVLTWGHPITSGFPEIDIFYSGQLLESDEADDHYREKMVRLPGTGACSIPMEFGKKPLSPDIVDLSRVDRSCTHFLICQRPMKFDPGFDMLYARIAAAGNAHFWFVRDRKIPWASEVVENRIKAAFESEGLDPGEYMTWIDWVPGDQFSSLLEEMDIYLDTPAFSGFTTAWQAIHCGLPIVTLEGDCLRQRLAAGLLRKIGMTDTIAKSVDEFVSIAVELGRDRNRLKKLRNLLVASAHLADEDISVVRAFEDGVTEALAAKRSIIEGM